MQSSVPQRVCEVLASRRRQEQTIGLAPSKLLPRWHCHCHFQLLCVLYNVFRKIVYNAPSIAYFFQRPNTQA